MLNGVAGRGDARCVHTGPYITHPTRGLRRDGKGERVFISRRAKRRLQEQIDQCASEQRLNDYIERQWKLTARLESLEKELGLVYEIKPSKCVHTRKGGPERPEVSP